MNSSAQYQTTPKLFAVTPIYQKRKFVNRLATLFCLFSVGFGLFWLSSILWTLFSHGFAGFMQLPIFSANTPPPNTIGGLKNAIVGSTLIVGTALLMGVPVGILTGVYLAEFDKGGLFGRATRFVSDSLLSAPSIVIGLFIYTLVVKGIKVGNIGIDGTGFSGFSGSLALALILVPVIIKNTETMLRLIPNTLREASFALGSPSYKMITAITLKSAKAGVITGVLLGFARIVGETAPLLFTALNNQYFSTDMRGEMANLPNTIYQLSMYPDEIWQQLAWSAALLIAIIVLILNLSAKFIGNKDHQ